MSRSGLGRAVFSSPGSHSGKTAWDPGKPLKLDEHSAAHKGEVGTDSVKTRAGQALAVLPCSGCGYPVGPASRPWPERRLQPRFARMQPGIGAVDRFHALPAGEPCFDLARIAVFVLYYAAMDNRP